MPYHILNCNSERIPRPVLAGLQGIFKTPLEQRDGSDEQNHCARAVPKAARMKIVFIHFHLKTGGVTTVLTQQVKALVNDAEMLVVAGTPPQSPLPVETAVVEGIGYDAAAPPLQPPEAVAAAVAAALKAKWKNGCDIVHVHNATLAKNRNFLKILRCLQAQNFRLFIQIHDFAEDGRPAAYFEDEYPRDCHYGVINSRDYRVLRRSGLRAEGLHLLPNMIRPREFSLPEAPSARTVLYPVRALRRKNIGEALLLSLFFPEAEALAVTLPPNSPMDIQSYRGWKAFVKSANLRVRFDTGLNADFEQLIRSARMMITTSIMEGFGFSFLEPWTSGKYLWGRNLPEICRDFEANGVRLQHLYRRLDIPFEWIAKESFRRRQFDAMSANAARFHFPIDPAAIRRTIRRCTAGSTIDFGLLDEALQKKVLERVIGSAAAKKRLIELNPRLAAPTDLKGSNRLVRHNRAAVERHYCEAVCRRNLLNNYRKIIKTPIRQQIDKRALLSHFFRPESFSLLKWGDYAG